MFNRGPETVRVGRVKVLNVGEGMARVTKGHEEGRETFRRQSLHTTAKGYVKAS